MATSVIRSSRYYGHLFLAARQNDHTSSWKRKTSLIRSPVNKARFFWLMSDRINGKLYIGETGRCMYEPIKEHELKRQLSFLIRPGIIHSGTRLSSA